MASPGGVCLVEAALMFLYSKWGKFRHRDKLLAQIAWSGNEHVLDVGTGRGLLLIGAAKRLTSGSAVGIDVWSTKDLSGNAQLATADNIKVEGVADKCTLETQSAQRLTFPDATFDVVLSNLCIHNIPSRGDRDSACTEIARVLKPGGHAIISDYKNIGQYSRRFRQSGLTIKGTMINPLSFRPLRTVVVVKGGNREDR